MTPSVWDRINTNARVALESVAQEVDTNVHYTSMFNAIAGHVGLSIRFKHPLKITDAYRTMCRTTQEFIRATLHLPGDDPREKLMLVRLALHRLHSIMSVQ